MTKQQKLDQILEAVKAVIKETTADTLRLQERLTMTQKTFDAIERLHEAYRVYDFFDYEIVISEGVAKGSGLQPTTPNDQRTDYAIQAAASESGDAS